MKPHPRIRETIKWGGAAVTVLLVVVWWVTSQRRIVLGGHDGRVVAISSGAVMLGPDDPDASLFGFPMDYPSEFAFTYWSPGSKLIWRPIRSVRVWGTTGCLPLWMLVAPVFVSTMAAWRVDTLSRRRAMLNLCPKCHYDRTGLAPSATCPECGHSAPLPTA